MWNRKIRILIIFFFMLFTAAIFPVLAQIRAIKLGNVAGPHSCVTTESQTSLFGLVDTYGFIIDSYGDGYLSNYGDVGLEGVLKIDSQCLPGPWQAPMEFIYPGVAGLKVISMSDDKNNSTGFFELSNEGGAANFKLYRSLKDGSLRTLIYSQLGDGQGWTSTFFDINSDKILATNPFQTRILRMFRDGTGVDIWDLAYVPRAVAVRYSDNSHYVVQAVTANDVRFYVYDAWGGSLVDTKNFTRLNTDDYHWLELDQTNNIIYSASPARLYKWDLTTDVFTQITMSILTSRQSALFGNYLYVKPGAENMRRYHISTLVEESWDGASYLR